ncbi:hypothetical protein JQK88_16515 [Mesorhizobium caraganae]|uniref:hypothetical protein n=1 Tax=Mesorhizobium caraganae TaxID=483206 RepID=UPI001939A489|nr:hypothetical protein [Mesorhizobium caraganae]MBM2712809.1 hypothetical protein [Mesorhizobium caraganae]
MASAAKRLGVESAIIHGEIVVLTEAGLSEAIGIGSVEEDTGSVYETILDAIIHRDGGMAMTALYPPDEQRLDVPIADR